MNQKTLISFFALALTFCGARAQMSLVNPVPHDVQSKGETVAAPTAWRIVCDKSRTSGIAFKTLTAAAPSTAKASFTVTLGVVGDKCAKAYAKRVPTQAEGYILETTKKGATIVGRDAQGLFYGVQSFLASLKQGKLECATVADWPDVRFRGVVEGFYGTPWSFDVRKSQIAFYALHKMNVYIYGPKDDPYHRDHWRQPYPEKEGRQIAELAAYARENGVNFYWAIHPGVDIKWTTEDRDALVAKFESMYDLGVRSFAVFFDDIWGEGTRADKQAELLNYVDDNFIQKKHDVSPLVMCPTEYNRSWANDEKGYLRTLGKNMNKGIEIMWTGDAVVRCIDRGTMEWVNSRIDRKAYIWWNYPVSDFVRDRVLLGPVYGNDTDIANTMSGFVSNPMEHAEASKIALYGIADYTWNMAAFNSSADWEQSIVELLPSSAQALRTFALYNRDLGQNGHGFRRAEGEELKDIAAAVEAGRIDAAVLDSIEQKSADLKTASDVLLASKENPQLIRELRPWLLQAKNLGDYGLAVRQLYADATTSSTAFTLHYQQARSIRQQMYELEHSSVRHAHQPGIKVGTKVMLPMLNRLFASAVDTYNKQTGSDLSNVADYTPFTLSSNVTQLAQLPVAFNNNEVSIAPSLEVINWQAGGELTIECENTVTLQGMDFNLGVEGAAQHFTLELLTPAGWQKVSLLHYKTSDPVIHTGNELSGMKATKIRLTNTSGSEQKVFFKRFAFVMQ